MRFFCRVENVHECSKSIVCTNDGPRLEGMAFAATLEAVQVAWHSGAFNCHKSKYNGIHEGEYTFSSSILKHGMNMDSLLLKYGQIDWRNETYWDCNDRVHPTRGNA